MAGEWIPVRTDIFDCPEVVRILSELCPNSVRNLSELCPDSVQAMSDRVRKSSEIVGTLVRLWALFDRYTEDGKLKNYTPAILDQMFGIDGFCSAVASVGWLEIGENYVEMPGFSKYLSKTAKARMKDAQRKKAERAASEICPKNVRNDSDENRTTKEKKRKQKNLLIPPKSPKGERVGFDPSEVFFPENLDTNEFRNVWRAWCSHRKEIKKVLTPTQCESQLSQLAAWGMDRAIAAINHTITMGWQGLREPQAGVGRSKSAVNEDVPF